MELRASWKSLNSMFTLQVIFPREVDRLTAYSADDKFLPFFFNQNTSEDLGKESDVFLAKLTSI